MNKQQMVALLETLVEWIDGCNDASQDEDRGRSNDALCLVLWDDGSGKLGTVFPTDPPDFIKDVGMFNLQCKFDNCEELAEYLAPFVELDTVSKTIHVETMVASQSKQGTVVFRWGDLKGELTPSETRVHALSLLEAADAAETDEFIWNWLERIDSGMPDMRRAAILQDFRRYRDEKAKPTF